MTFEEKIQSIKSKNRIKSFGYTIKNLEIFTNKELRKLNDNGLITNKDLHTLFMKF